MILRRFENCLLNPTAITEVIVAITRIFLLVKGIRIYVVTLKTKPSTLNIGLPRSLKLIGMEVRDLLEDLLTQRTRGPIKTRHVYLKHPDHIYLWPEPGTPTQSNP